MGGSQQFEEGFRAADSDVVGHLLLFLQWLLLTPLKLVRFINAQTVYPRDRLVAQKTEICLPPDKVVSMLHDEGALLRCKLCLMVQKVISQEEVDWEVGSEKLGLTFVAFCCCFGLGFRLVCWLLPFVEGVKYFENSSAYFAMNSECISFFGAFGSIRVVAFKNSFNVATP